VRLPTVAAVVKRALVICTANICRSPVVERLLRRSLDGAVDVDGDAWVVSSAGTADIWPPVDCHTIGAAASVDIDLSGHQRRTLTHDLIGTDGADLILAMTRAQLRVVASLDPYGGSASEHATMVEQVASAVDIVRHGPWAPPR